MNVANDPITVHPSAEAYRLMTDEELASLASDIAKNGQNDPIILARVEGSIQLFLVDGRNRLKACEIAKAEPKYETMFFKDDEAVRAFVKSRSERRDLTKGQRAIGLAFLYPEKGGKGGKGKKDAAANPAVAAGFGERRLQQAREVLAFSPKLAVSVRDNQVSLDEALEKVKEHQKQLASTDAMVTRLRSEAPDLADLVTEERLKLPEAIKALDSRIAETKRARETATRVLQSVFNAIYPRDASPEDWAERLTKDVDPEFWSGADEFSFTTLAACADVMQAIANRFKT